MTDNLSMFLCSYNCSSAMYIQCLLHIQFNTTKDGQHGVKLHCHQINDAVLFFNVLYPVSSDECTA